jgi:hypothetical protein
MHKRIWKIAREQRIWKEIFKRAEKPDGKEERVSDLFRFHNLLSRVKMRVALRTVIRPIGSAKLDLSSDKQSF